MLGGPIDVWITDDGLPTRVVMAEGFFPVQVDLTEFGLEVPAVEPPSADDVYTGGDSQELVAGWLVPAVLGAADDVAHSFFCIVGEGVSRFGPEARAEVEKALAQIEAQLAAPDLAEAERAGLEAAAASIRAFLDTAGTASTLPPFADPCPTD
jgi:hypothetical protein